MKLHIRLFGAILPAIGVILLLSSCVFEKPVYGGGLSSPNPAWQGLWTTQTQDGKTQTATLIPLDRQRCLLHYPATAEGWYFEAQSIRSRGRDLLQLEILAEPNAKIPVTGAARFTLLWIEPAPDGALSVRALSSDAVKRAALDPRSMRKFLASEASDWNRVFGDPLVFTKK